MEVINKKSLTLTIMAVVTLIALVAGATYAYFAVGTTNNFGTTTIEAKAGSIGSVILTGSNAQLKMDLTAVDMMKQGGWKPACLFVKGEASDCVETNEVYQTENECLTHETSEKACIEIQGNVIYYATSDGKTTDVSKKETVLGTASVSPTDDTNYYECSYTLEITHSGEKDMYDTFVSSSNTTKSVGQVILTINGEDYDWYTKGIPETVNGSFSIKAGSPVNITAGLRLINSSTIKQNAIAGTDININIKVKDNSFVCSTKEEPKEVVSYYTYEGETITSSNLHKVSDYRNLNVYRRLDSSANRYYVYPTSSVETCQSDNGVTACESLVQPYFIKETSTQVIATEPINEVQISMDDGNAYSTYGYYTEEEYAAFLSMLGGELACDGTPTNLSGTYAKCIAHESGYTYQKTKNEACVNINGTVVCIKGNDWENVETYKTAFENAGWQCDKDDSSMTCAEDLNSLSVGSLSCRLNVDGVAYCEVHYEGLCGVGPGIAECHY